MRRLSALLRIMTPCVESFLTQTCLLVCFFPGEIWGEYFLEILVKGKIFFSWRMEEKTYARISAGCKKSSHPRVLRVKEILSTLQGERESCCSLSFFSLGKESSQTFYFLQSRGSSEQTPVLVRSGEILMPLGENPSFLVHFGGFSCMIEQIETCTKPQGT